MKRQILFSTIALVAMLASACELRNIPAKEELKTGEYIGDYTVKKEGKLTYDKQNVIFHAAVGADQKTISLTMNRVKFATLMPVTLTITASDMECTTADGVTTATVESIVPTVDDVPMEKYVLYDLNIRMTDEKLNVSFFCKENVVDFEGVR